MLKIDAKGRATAEDIGQNPWFMKSNPLMSSTGRCADGIGLATRLIEGLRVEFEDQAAQVQATPEDDFQSDSGATPRSTGSVVPGTQPELSSREKDSTSLEWDNDNTISLSQPTQYLRDRAELLSQDYHNDVLSQVVEDPSMSQFAGTPSVPLSLTQQARRFQDICPSSRLTRFYTTHTFSQFMPLITSALQTLQVAVPNADKHASYYDGKYHTEWIKIKMRDSRRCPMTGSVGVERVAGSEMGFPGEQGLLCVSFDKTKGDPLEWRRFFKKAAVLCKDAIYRGSED